MVIRIARPGELIRMVTPCGMILIVLCAFSTSAQLLNPLSEEPADNATLSRNSRSAAVPKSVADRWQDHSADWNFNSYDHVTGDWPQSSRQLERSERILDTSTYTFLTSDTTVIQFYLILISQLVFTTIGWFISSVIWSLERGGELVDDIDIPDAISFITQPQTVANNIAIATGYWACVVVVWSLIGLLEPGGDGAKRRQQQTVDQENDAIVVTAELDSVDSISTEQPAFTAQGEEKTLGTQALVAFDNQLSFTGTTRWFFVNTVFTLGSLLFWTLTAFLPNAIPVPQGFEGA